VIKLNDHYFISWLNVVKGINYQIIDNKIVVDISSKEYAIMLEEYNKDLKPLFKSIRATIKELNKLTQ